MEEGDDRLRPAMMLHVGGQEHFFANAYIAGRRFANVYERTSLLSLNYPFPIYSKDSGLQASIGLVSMLEETRIDDPTSDEVLLHQNSYNFGMALGAHWENPKSPVFLIAGWDSHLFFAGDAGIFLSTARKEMLSLGTGFRF